MSPILGMGKLPPQIRAGFEMTKFGNHILTRWWNCEPYNRLATDGRMIIYTMKADSVDV